MKLQQVKDNWQQTSGKKKIATLIFLGSIVVGIILLLWYLFVPKYVPLFTNLSPEQANSITQTLSNNNLPYELEAAGKTVSVPEDKVHEIRVQMAGEGLYNNGIGYELFDGVNLGITDFERRLNLQRALEEELRRTIVQYNEIEQARVHLVLPEESLFENNSSRPTASVSIKVTPFQQMNSEQIRSLVYLVAMSVPDLAPDDVTVIDMSGQILSDAVNFDNESEFGLSAGQLELKRGFEEELENRLIKMLEKIYGPNQVVAMVSADLNFDHSTVTEIIYDENNTVLRSEHVNRESVNGNNPDGGVPGTGSNIPVYPEGEENEDYYYENEEIIRNWEVGSRETTSVTAPGRIENISTSVTVSSDLTEAEKAEIQQLVAGAVGANFPQGDTVTISGIAFNKEHLEDLESEFEHIAEQEKFQQYLSYGLKGLALVLAFVLTLVIALKLFRPMLAGQTHVASVKKTVEDQVAAAQDSNSNLDYIRKLTDSNPSEVANVLRAWANED